MGSNTNGIVCFSKITLILSTPVAFEDGISLRHVIKSICVNSGTRDKLGGISSHTVAGLLRWEVNILAIDTKWSLRASQDRSVSIS